MTRDKINVIYNHEMDWILARLAKGLIDGLPNARDVDYGDVALINAPDTAINYYINLRTGFKKKSAAIDVALFDHKAPDADDYSKAQKLDHIVCIAPQYQRHLQSMGVDASLVIVPVDDKYTPKLVLGWCGKFQVGPHKQDTRKGRALLDKVAALPFVDLRITDGKIHEEEMPEWYRGLDYVIVTSAVEGGPMCLYQGLACGKRIIIPRTVGGAELFPDGTIDYPTGDYGVLEVVLSSLYAQKKKLADMVSRYTWDYWVDQHAVIFDRLQGQRAATIEPCDYDRAIVVIATHEIDEITKYTLPAIEAYANRCNAELIVWRDCPPEYQHPKYRIMALRDVKARRVLHLDGDCQPLSDAPDIFEANPPGAVYAWDEMEIRSWNTVRGFQRTISQHAGEAVSWDRHWWNPGVMLCDREHLQLFEMPPWDVTDQNHLWFGNTVKNQPWINWRIRKCGIHVKPLDRRYNTITTLPDSKPDKAYILHHGAEKIPDAWERKIAIVRAHAKPRVLMATVVSGDTFEDLYKLIGPYHEAYSKRHGYDYRVIRGTTRTDWPSPSWWKLDLYSDLDDYDCVVYVDADAWPWEDAPSIVDAVPRGKFGAFNSLTIPYMNDRNSHSQKSYRDWCERAGLCWKDHDPIDIGYYINGGVWLCWREARDVLTCDTPVETPLYVEQHQLNLNLYERPGLYHELGREWNYGHLSHGPNKTAAAGAHIAHLSGVKSDRVDTFKQVLSIRRRAQAQETASDPPVVHAKCIVRRGGVCRKARVLPGQN
jgi:hypothetical protein